ncbi:hypothetical protein LY90DRAFT_665659 [Neocallimastix californiae]|jgi:hypothetical protein|uniref:DUF676 domain-containing protein n=1 Tax=Neocallimastix californiae TaxID=1754190 RepID=A0A1Y2EX43_9FUNG|nr:hypothetical protein LY90DRAFT_665659 [Neocallimastix californiae]|eukprot:ORY76153.1 hypothetical protein LY90DRAFT_665659 [Neocallimastix californiae]
MQYRNSKRNEYIYNFKNYKGNYLTPFLETKTVIVVYVHGFLGDNNTFHEFPNLLKDSLKLYNVRIINKIFPAFETNGVFDDFVNMIIDWLYENTEDYPIILMGHSMGGILNADVYRKISKGNVEPKHMNEKPPKIIGVFGFDTPYFGLSSFIAVAGIRKVKEAITKASNLATNYVASFLLDTDDYHATHLINGPINNRIENKNENENENENNNKNENENENENKNKNKNNNENKNENRNRNENENENEMEIEIENTNKNKNENENENKNENKNKNKNENKNESKNKNGYEFEYELETPIIERPIPNSTSPIDYTRNENNTTTIIESNGKSKWNILKSAVLTTATIAAIGTSLLNNSTRQAAIITGQHMIAEGTQYLTNYGRFLEPLIEISKQRQRVDDLINSARKSVICGKERFKFKNYYPITQRYNNDGTINKSTFVCLPQELRYLKFFDPIPGPKNSPDPVYSHTRIFNSRTNNENVHILVEKCIIDMYKVIRTLY